eukprot:3994971-Prorocentrum_lima.AAC.1
MRDGNYPNALVVDGCSLYERMRHPIGDPYHLLRDPDNIEHIDHFILEAVQSLQLLFWGHKAL